jgi:putative RecB family exonuclease
MKKEVIKNAWRSPLLVPRKSMGQYSHSKLSTFEQCPQKYKFRYIDGIEPPQRTIELFLGDLVHQTLQKLYRDLQTGKLNHLDEVLAYYREQWEANYSPEIRIVRTRKTTGSYLESGQRMIESYYRRFHPFQQGTTLAVELDVYLPLADGATFCGVVDRLARTREHSYEIHDYKTSRRLPSPGEVREDQQLPLYELAIRHRWPDTKKVELVWHYLAFDTELRVRKTPKQLQAARESTLNLIQQVEGTRFFPTRESALCDWCEYYSICPAKQGRSLVAAGGLSTYPSPKREFPGANRRPPGRIPGRGLLVRAFRFLGILTGRLLRWLLNAPGAPHVGRRG